MYLSECICYIDVDIDTDVDANTDIDVDVVNYSEVGIARIDPLIRQGNGRNIEIRNP